MPRRSFEVGVVSWVLLGLVAIASPARGADVEAEPPVKYTLVIDGRPHPLEVGKALELPGAFTNPKVELQVSTTRTFQYADVEFEYPASFGWEADTENPAQTIWTISGNDFKIMFIEQQIVLSPDAFLRLLVSQFGDLAPQIDDVERELGGAKHRGKRTVIKVATSAIATEAYLLQTKIGSRLIVFQDTPVDGKPWSLEGTKSFALFSKSFQDKQGRGEKAGEGKGEAKREEEAPKDKG